jgi:hypothetical protein
LALIIISYIYIKFVTQSKTGLQIYEGHDDQLNRPGLPNHETEYSLFFFFLISPWVGIEPATHASLGCDSRINAKAIRMRKVVKCERFARIGILELHFRLRTPKSANGTLRVVHYHSQVLCVVCKFNSNISNLTSEITSNLK